MPLVSAMTGRSALDDVTAVADPTAERPLTDDSSLDILVRVWRLTTDGVPAGQALDRVLAADARH